MGSTLDSLILLAGMGIIAYVVLTKNPISNAVIESSNLPSQNQTSPQRETLGGLQSTNQLGLIFGPSIDGTLSAFQLGLANLRDNLSVGGLLFKG